MHTICIIFPLAKITDIEQLEVGDMVIKPGSPGHVVMIVDCALDAKEKKYFILAQGNTPAQSVHMLKNLNSTHISPCMVRPAINMGEEINTERDDAYGSVTPDGKYFLFNRVIFRRNHE